MGVLKELSQFIASQVCCLHLNLRDLMFVCLDETRKKEEKIFLLFSTAAERVGHNGEILY